ncbi:acyl-CoA thioesterase [Metabacillus sp. GX 13764]|uniref:acyl-CoA thioesterase n=1 Tax=Metabacillus kandeliae TaxID=2900151 RepID=UPI001E5561CF|nr:thioesterase family protein [Metabacillus kandeliae]MCD7032695.1 acyl-CoA thioesterase [Metabacillus kandeliae]
MVYHSRIKVRFCETDALGHVNNTSYFIYMEEARVEFFEKIGFEMNANEWQFILASASCDFLDQVRFNDVLLIETAVSKIGNKSFHLEQLMRIEATGKIAAKGHSVIVTYDFENQKSTRIPEEIRAELERHPAASSI